MHKGIINVKTKPSKSYTQFEKGGITYYEMSNTNAEIEAYIDKDCLSREMLYSKQFPTVHWIVVEEIVWDRVLAEYNKENKLNTTHGNAETLEKIQPHILYSFTGNAIQFNLGIISGDLTAGNVYLLMPFSKFPEKDIPRKYLRLVYVKAPHIRYAYIQPPSMNEADIPPSYDSKLHLYGMNAKLNISNHLLPDFRKQLEDNSKTCTVRGEVFFVNEGNEEVIVDSFTETIDATSYNSYKEFNVFINPEWRDMGTHEKPNQSQKYYIKLHAYITNRDFSVAQNPDSDDPYDFNSRLKEMLVSGTYNTYTDFQQWRKFNAEKDQWEDLPMQPFIEVRFDTMEMIYRRIEIEKTNMIKYIGDIKYLHKENDPCGYSKIIIKDDDDDKRDELFIFNENNTEKPIDNTTQIFGIIAGDTRKNISITLDNLTTKQVFCQGLLLESGKKHSDSISNIFQVHKVYSAKKVYDPKTKTEIYSAKKDETHEEQLKNAKILVTKENSTDYDVSADYEKGLSKDVSNVQGWQLGIDYKFEDDNKMIIMPRYVYNKTVLEKVQIYSSSSMINKVKNDFWLFNYFFLNDKLAQTYFIPISTCRYPNQIAKINVYPDIEWTMSLKLGSSTPNVYSHTNMPAGPAQNSHQQRGVDAGQNRRWLNREVSFELTIKATTGSVEKSIGVSYEEKIEKLLKILIKIKEVLDSLCGITSARQGMARQIASSLPGFLVRSPFTFQLDYPVISVEGGWKFDYSKISKKIELQGKLAVGLTPLIKGTGKIDLIAYAEFIPPAKPIILAIRTAVNSVGAEIWFNLYAFGQIDMSFTFLFGATTGTEPINVATTVGFGAELGVRASSDVPALNFGSHTTSEIETGFEASAKGETSIVISSKYGANTDGMYFEPSLGFGGMVVFVTAKAKIWRSEIGFEDKSYELIEPKPDLLKGRLYIIEANKKNDNENKN